jgi:hypothetical protein
MKIEITLKKHLIWKAIYMFSAYTQRWIQGFIKEGRGPPLKLVFKGSTINFGFQKGVPL